MPWEDVFHNTGLCTRGKRCFPSVHLESAIQSATKEGDCIRKDQDALFTPSLAMTLRR